MTEYEVVLDVTLNIKVKADSGITAEDEAVKVLKAKFPEVHAEAIDILSCEEMGPG
jgi:hypothetical protein